jgi:membrane-bound lytic murein transglycosylase B
MKLNRFRTPVFILTLVVGVLLLPAQWHKTASGAEPSDHGDFREWLQSLRKEARDQGISEATLDAALHDTVPLARVIELDRHQPEFTSTFSTYLRRRVTEGMRERGRSLLARHRDLLEEIHAEYGVPPRYLIALWGLETSFGENLGGFRVIQALATLAYDRRRPRFFRTELLHALRIIEQGHITPDAMTGSWAGATGHMQFMPSTFIDHAVDYTGNGQKDIWGDLADAFASAANFLSNTGWRPGEIWGRQVRLPEEFDLRLASLETRKPLEEWSALGVRRMDSAALPHADMEGSIVLPQGHRGPAFLVYNNFRVIMRWNNSINYAISVGHLADRIVGMPPITAGMDVDNRPLSTQDVKDIQRSLNLLGFEAGTADGLPGPRTQAAIRAFQEKHSLPPDGYPTRALLKRLRAPVEAPRIKTR